MRKFFVAVSLAGGLAAVAWAVLHNGSADDAPSPATAPPATPASGPTEPTAAPAVGATAPAPSPKPAPEDRTRQLQLPDGSYVSALNGATNPRPLKEYWGPLPWSPIVGVETNDQGVAWYRHENGSYSTTETLWDSAGKRQITLTRVAHAGPAETPASAPKR